MPVGFYNRDILKMHGFLILYWYCMTATELKKVIVVPILTTVIHEI